MPSFDCGVLSVDHDMTCSRIHLLECILIVYVLFFVSIEGAQLRADCELLRLVRALGQRQLPGRVVSRLYPDAVRGQLLSLRKEESIHPYAFQFILVCSLCR